MLPDKKVYDCIFCYGYCKPCELYLPFKRYLQSESNYCCWKETVDNDFRKWVEGKNTEQTFRLEILIKELEAKNNETSSGREQGI